MLLGSESVHGLIAFDPRRDRYLGICQNSLVPLRVSRRAPVASVELKRNLVGFLLLGGFGCGLGGLLGFQPPLDSVETGIRIGASGLFA